MNTVLVQPEAAKAVRERILGIRRLHGALPPVTYGALRVPASVTGAPRPWRPRGQLRVDFGEPLTRRARLAVAFLLACGFRPAPEFAGAVRRIVVGECRTFSNSPNPQRLAHGLPRSATGRYLRWYRRGAGR